MQKLHRRSSHLGIARPTSFASGKSVSRWKRSTSVAGTRQQSLSSGLEKNPTPPPLLLCHIDRLCTQILLLNGERSEGIFRVPGNSQKINQIIEELPSPDLDFGEDVDDIAGALKQYLRDQPTSLLSNEIINRVKQSDGAAASKHPFGILFPDTRNDELARLIAVVQYLKEIEDDMKPLLRRILVLLHEIVENEKITKMNADNLGMVFGQVLIHQPYSNDASEVLRGSAQSTEVIRLMLKYSQLILDALPEVVSSFALFGNYGKLSEDDWKLLMTKSKEVTFTKNREIVMEGSQNKYMYKIIKGEVRIVKGGHFIRSLKEGDMFGEISLLSNEGASATVIPNEFEVVMTQIEIPVLRQILSTNPNVASKFYHRIARTLANTLRAMPSQVSDYPIDVSSGTTRTDLVRIYTIDDNFRTCKFTPATTFGDLIHSFKLPDKSGFNFFEISESITEPNLLPKESMVYLHIQRHRADPTHKFYFASKPPISPLLKSFRLKDTNIVKACPCKHKRRGTIFITANQIAHISKTLGFEQKVVIKFNSIMEVIQKDKDVMGVRVNGSSKTLQFKFDHPNDCEEILSLISALVEKSGMAEASSSSVAENGSTSVNAMDLTNDDWKLIFEGSSERTYQEGEAIIALNGTMQRIYQVQDGSCSVQRDGIEMCKLMPGDVFGEVSFLLGGGASADVVAGTNLTLFMLEAEYLKRLFRSNASLAGKFFYYLSNMLQERIRRRQAELQKK